MYKNPENHEEIEYLMDLLTNDETALETAKEHLEIDTHKSKAFQPELKFSESSPLAILNDSEADRGLMGFFNARSRRARYKRFEKRLKRNPGSEVIISEGDSWFQYPVFLKDVIDHLSEVDDWAIRSFGYGGDWLSNILEEAEYINAIRYYNPKVFLVSGGGNDIVGERLTTLLKPYNKQEPGRKPGDYLGDDFHQVISDLKFLYHRLFTKLTSEFKALNIICHGYDYAIPGEKSALPMGGWLQDPMEKLGIENKELQCLIIEALIDEFNKMLGSLVADNKYDGRVHFLDNRGTVSATEWFDELHPRSFAFMKVAQQFKSKIYEII